MRHPVCTALLLSALAPAAGAQNALPPATTTASTAPTGQSAAGAPIADGRITGHVICNDTRRPARGAFVTVVRTADLNGTDAFAGFRNMAATHVRSDGTYLVEHLQPGSYVVFAALTGYLSDIDSALATDAHLGASAKLQEMLNHHGTVAVRAGDTAGFDLVLERGAALSGRVVYADGAPAAAVNLVLEDAKAKPAAYDKNAAEEQITRAFSSKLFKKENTSTDDQGRFRLAGLRPGSYRVAATEPLASGSDGPEARGEQIGLAIFDVPDPRAMRVYAGDTMHAAAAEVFDLRAGDDVAGVDITLPLGVLHDVRGVVLATDSRPVNMGELTLTDTTDTRLAFRTDLARDGSFDLQQVPAGTYTLTCSGAFVGEPIGGSSGEPPGVPEASRPLKPVAAFADGSVAVIVGDSDVEGRTLTLTEIPLPKVGSPSPADEEP